MKKVLFIVAGVVGALLLLLILVPLLFKDKIFEKVDEQLAKSINADVHYNPDKISLSVLRNFPHVTAGLEDFSIVGKDRFAGDTLIAADEFKIVLNLKSVLFGDQMQIRAIEVEKPFIQILVLEDGTANYDIAIEEETLPGQETPAAEFNVGIQYWQINQGRIVYEDRSLPLRMLLEGVTHSGSGDFTQDIFDMETHTEARRASMVYDGIPYVTNKHLEADATISMNLPEMRFTFKDNLLELNDFAVRFDGWLAMPNDPIEFDMQFEAPKNTFKSLLSLVPGMYNEHFENLEASGEVAFQGYLKGVYSETSMPGYRVALQVNDGRFRYPDLPEEVKGVNVDMVVEDKAGDMKDLHLLVNQFSMNMGNNPVKGTLETRGLQPMQVKADIDARLNLAELDKILKLDTMVMRGLFSLNLKADGVYDSLQNRFPRTNATMALKDGYFKTASYPIPVQEFNFNGTVLNENGSLEATVVNIPTFSMLVDKDRLQGRLQLQDLNDYRWDAALQGTLDLTTIGKIIEFEDMELAGRIIADIQTRGRMSALDAGRYDELPTSGTMAVQDFKYSSKDLPYDFLLSAANMRFNPQAMVLESFAGQIGDTDLQLTGTVRNYLGYALKENQTLYGDLKLVSKRANLNQWMTDDGTVDTTAADSGLEPIEIPQNIDMKFQATIGEVLYDNLTLSNMVGQLVAQNGQLRMDGLSFQTLGGKFGLSGLYDPREISKPKFDFAIRIDQLSIQKAFQNFVTIQQLAPIAERMDGLFTTDFNLSGTLTQSMMPDMASLSGSGFVKVMQATLENSAVLQKVALATKLTDNLGAEVLKLKDVLMKVKVAGGGVNVEPFDFNVGNIPITLSGRQGFDKSLNYQMKLEVPSGAVGQAANNLLAQYGVGSVVGDKIPLNLGIGGTATSPQVQILGVAGGSAGQPSVTDAAKDVVKQQVDAQIDNAKEELDAKRKEAEAQAQAELDKRKAEAEAKAKEEAEKRKRPYRTASTSAAKAS
ncbi:AsmA-like C-terminal region-containing protein [Cesiribacter andamanensis]|uniref:AsmA domain-containing protein n=1 Tax=Cesiribacter andamanensis AMV16 TaxID=1279009 RepID=M7N138_9BACT|nr:AsmA-like C-terminal region-containing protein [Cesiribacter andamanensis]EMR00926.1 putative protein involved in outer membrane biogenesis [Cesiribacter andamanensis AMV16]